MSTFNLGEREIFYIILSIKHYRKELLASEEAEFEEIVNNLKILDAIEAKLGNDDNHA